MHVWILGVKKGTCVRLMIDKSTSRNVGVLFGACGAIRTKL